MLSNLDPFVSVFEMDDFPEFIPVNNKPQLPRCGAMDFKFFSI